MASRAGLPLQDMEFVQFHPSGIYGAGVGTQALNLRILKPNNLARSLSQKVRAAKAATSSTQKVNGSWSVTRQQRRTLHHAMLFHDL